MEKVPTPLDAVKIMARHKKTNETCQVLLICFVNRYVDVLPDSELEGGNQVSWFFEDIDLLIRL